MPLGRDRESRIIAAELPPQEELRREREFEGILLVAVLIGLALGALVVLTLLVSGGDTLQVDVPVARAVQGVDLPLYGWALAHASDLGWFPANAAAFAVVVLAFLALRLRLEAVLAVAGPLLSGILGGVFGALVQRPRPTSDLIHVAGSVGGYSFPSGHVIMYTTLFGFAFYAAIVTWRGGVGRNLILVALAALVVLIGPSRVYLGQHWASDVLGAYLFAGLCLAAMIQAHIWLKPRLGHWWSDQPSPATRRSPAGV